MLNSSNCSYHRPTVVVYACILSHTPARAGLGLTKLYYFFCPTNSPPLAAENKGDIIIVTGLVWSRRLPTAEFEVVRGV